MNSKPLKKKVNECKKKISLLRKLITKKMNAHDINLQGFLKKEHARILITDVYLIGFLKRKQKNVFYIIQSY